LELIDNIRNGLNTGFIDGTSVSIAEYQPDLIVNDSRRGCKLLTTLAAEMRRCEEFFFCVAFIITVSNIKLWRLLNRSKIIKHDLVKAAGANSSTIIRLNKGLTISNSAMIKFCRTLH